MSGGWDNVWSADGKMSMDDFMDRWPQQIEKKLPEVFGKPGRG
ncbi:hypothetical protein [Agathobacter rectalis]|nr:hypothetical protein [Agathobacter rectalis]